MKKVLVIGESCRDVFIYCDALRLCPDVPVPVLNIKNETDNPGMAKNVYMNIKSLIDDCDVITNENWYEITKTRYVDEKSNHTFFRVDTPHNISRIDLILSWLAILLYGEFITHFLFCFLKIRSFLFLTCL